MNKNSNFNLGYLILGVFIILYIIYIRLLLVRLPKELWLYNEGKINYSLALVLLISIIAFSNIFIMNLFLLYKIEIKASPLLAKFLFKIKDIIDKALLELYKFSVTFESDNYNNMARKAAKFYSIFGHITETFFINISICSRLLIVVIFLIDVFYFFRLDYFYKALILLCIPIGVNVWFYMLKDFVSNLEDAKKTLIIKDEGMDEKTGLPITRYSRNPENDIYIDLKYHVEQYILLSKLNGYLQVYKLYSNFLTIRFDILISSIYLIGWFYILYCGFQKF
jgi:hypothetical protein